MLPGIAVAGGSAGVSPAVHPAPPLSALRWRLALRSRAGPSQAARRLRQPGRLRGIVRLNLQISAPPYVGGNDRRPRLSALVDVKVFHGLLARLVELGQRLQCRPAVALSLQRQPPVALGSVQILAHVVGRSPRQFGKHAVQCDCLSRQHPTGHRQLPISSLVGFRLDEVGIVADAGQLQIVAHHFGGERR